MWVGMWSRSYATSWIWASTWCAPNMWMRWSPEVAVKVEERLLDLLSATKGKAKRRDQLRRQLRAGNLDQQSVQIEVPKDRTPMVEVFSAAGNLEEMSINLQEMLTEMTPRARKERHVSLADARHLLTQEETQKQIDRDQVVAEAIERVTNAGIVFLDEIDKIAGEPAKNGPDISREGVATGPAANHRGVQRGYQIWHGSDRPYPFCGSRKPFTPRNLPT